MPIESEKIYLGFIAQSAGTEEYTDCISADV